MFGRQLQVLPALEHLWLCSLTMPDMMLAHRVLRSKAVLLCEHHSFCRVRSFHAVTAGLVLARPLVLSTG